MKIKLETERLILRCQKKQDLDFLLELWTDEEMTKHVGGPRKKAKLIDSFDEVQINGEEKYDLWYIDSKESGKPVGMAGLLEKEIDNENHYEVSYIISKKHWNNGYATEIAQEIISHYRDNEGINTYVAIISKENAPSMRVAEKIGMTHWKTVTRNGAQKEMYKGEFE